MVTNSVSQPYEWTFRRVVWSTLVLAFVVLCFWLLYRFYNVAFTLFIAIVIGTVIRPIANWLNQRGVPRIPAVILIYFVMLLLIAGFLWLLFPHPGSIHDHCQRSARILSNPARRISSIL
jgi:predicted PurR-regulated permease PerM